MDHPLYPTDTIGIAVKDRGLLRDQLVRSLRRLWPDATYAQADELTDDLRAQGIGIARRGR